VAVGCTRRHIFGFYYLMLRRTQMMNFLLLAKQGNHGGIAPT
jgi:hypothetical protein